jgi:hypothetical protein
MSITAALGLSLFEKDIEQLFLSLHHVKDHVTVSNSDEGNSKEKL